ncbi:hypothetical protein ACTJK3_02860 [Pseudomonas sp. 22105]|uniref:hypothetical protein n=1 Tax=unclassified Pseudomonas TaxID=196821 RepID=UPI003F86C585
MGQINPNGTYNRRVYDAGESHNATLTINSSDPQTGNISQASMAYFGLYFNVAGSFFHQNPSYGSAVNFNLQAEAGGPEFNMLAISMSSHEESCSNLNGTVRVDRGGPNVGKTYNITFTKC